MVGQLRSDSAVKNLTLFFITLFKDALGGKRCPPQCIFGHTCPFGGACKFRRTCRFKHLHLVWLLSVVIPLVVPCPNSFFCRRPLTLYRLPRRSIARRQNCMRDTGFTRRVVYVKSSNVYSYVQRRNFLHVFHQRLSYSLADIQRDASFSAIMDTSFSETSSDASFTHASPTLSLLYIGRILPLVLLLPIPSPRTCAKTRTLRLWMEMTLKGLPETPVFRPWERLTPLQASPLNQCGTGTQ